MRTRAGFVVALMLIAPGAARAEFQLSVYGGANAANSSDLHIHSPGLTDTFDVDWYGNSFSPPPYWGARGTWWLNDFNMPRLGVAVDFTHAKAKADLDDAEVGAAFSHLEFTNGLNTVTLNGLYRRSINARCGSYLGFGVGAAVPHVEVNTIPSQGETWEYQLDGPAVQGLIGARLEVAHGFSLFGEYKANYAWINADLKGGGNLETNILTNQFAFGISYAFGGPTQYYLSGAGARPSYRPLRLRPAIKGHGHRA